ncbi:hypothetical protein [Collimonas sp.]|jgi:hypothetical protein|uniref:hypothetical protein n=1 Tax=Collimonas sp. TaxID=1963772 RepID=UPI002BB0EB81|nr:hypothetical protein [Collimonas sp.]HWW05966.1 hypothetical protein [Collimonas sp.]
MRKRVQRNAMPDELMLATGLVWGHLNAFQFEEAYRLARGCLCIWPADKWLILMASYAAAELLEPVEREVLLALKDEECAEWVALVLRRMEIHDVTAAAPYELTELNQGKPSCKR